NAGICAASNGHHLYTVPMDRQPLKVEMPVVPARAAMVVARLPECVGQLYHRRLTKSEAVLLSKAVDTLDQTEKATRTALAAERQHVQSVVFTAPGVQLWSHLVETSFPDYTQVIPQQYVAQLACPKGALREVLDACAPLLAAAREKRGSAYARGLAFVQGAD